MKPQPQKLSRQEAHDLGQINRRINLSYLAGLIDGEGTICITINRAGRRTQFQPRLQIANTNEALLQSVRCFIGAGHVTTNPRRNLNWKTGYQYALSGRALYPLLKRLSPRLILKAQQACLVMSWLEARSLAGTRPYTEDNVAKVAAIKLLNTKGEKPNFRLVSMLGHDGDG